MTHTWADVAFVLAPAAVVFVNALAGLARRRKLRLALREVVREEIAPLRSRVAALEAGCTLRHPEAAFI